MKFSWRKWKLGAVVALGLSLATAGAGLAVGMTWQAFTAVFCVALLANFGAFLKQHPIESIEETTLTSRVVEDADGNETKTKTKTIKTTDHKES